MRSRLIVALLGAALLVGCTSAPKPTPESPPPVTQNPPATPAPAPSGPCETWPTATAGEGQVLIWFHCNEEPKAVVRSVPAGTEPLQAAYAELVKGPNAEEQKAGFFSWFKAQTAGALRSATVQDGLLVVDLTDVRAQMTGASSSAGSQMLVGQLGRTGAQFPAVRQMEFRIMGSCPEFGDWIQTGCGVFPAAQYR